MSAFESRRGRAVPRRFVLVALCFIAIFICYIDRVNISVASIAMGEALGWTATEKGLVLSSFFIGYLLAQIPSGAVSARVGGKALLGFALIWWSVSTMLTPLAAAFSFAALISARIAMGLGEAATFPAVYNLYAYWVPRDERTRAIALSLAGIPFGTVFALAATGPLVEAFGWESAFYVFGVVGLAFAAVWYAMVHQTPQRHPGISTEEVERIERGVDMPDAGGGAILPLLGKAPVWALIVNHFCSNWSLYVFLAWLPSYFSDVQNLSLSHAGFFSVAPWICLFAGSNLSALCADAMIKRGVSITHTRKLMQCVGLLGSAAFLIAATFAQSASAAMWIFCGALGLLGVTWSGYAPNHLDIAPRQAGFLMGITNTFGTIPGIVGVFVTGWLIDATGTYASAFSLSAGLSVLGAIVWLIWARGEPLEDRWGQPA